MPSPTRPRKFPLRTFRGAPQKAHTPAATPSRPAWTFLTNHSHVLLLIVENPESRMRDLAIKVGITERAVQRIVDDLVKEGYLSVIKQGRRNSYTVVRELHLRHPVEQERTIGDLIHMVHRI